MSDRLRSWWRERTQRERWLLGLLALVALPTLIWYGAVLPYSAAIERAHLARDADARALGDVLMMAGKIQAAVRAADRVSALDTLVRSQADRAGFTVAGMARDGTGAVLTIDAVRPQPFFAWIASLRQRHGLFVTRLSARPNADSTLMVVVRLERAR